MAAAEACCKLDGHGPGRVTDEVVDVVVLADGEALPLARAAAVDVAVDLEQDAPLVQSQTGVGVRLVDDGGGSVGSDVEELAPIAAGGDVDHDVEILAGGVERALDAGIEGGRDDQLLRQPITAKQRRQAGQPRVERGRLEITVEREVQFVVQRPDAVPGRHGLRDVCQAARAVAELESLREQRRQLIAADAAHARAENGNEPARRERAQHFVVVVFERRRRHAYE